MRIRLLLVLLSISFVCFSKVADIEGIVKLANREPAAYAVVYIDELKKYTTTDDNGTFIINDGPFGQSEIQVRMI